MNCPYCGAQNIDGATRCVGCDASLQAQAPPTTPPPPVFPAGGSPTMICRKCGGNNVLVQPVSEVQKRGCLSILMYLILLCIPVIGWIALFMLLRGRKSKTVTYAVCQTCGNRWGV